MYLQIGFAEQWATQDAVQLWRGATAQVRWQRQQVAAAAEEPTGGAKEHDLLQDARWVE